MMQYITLKKVKVKSQPVFRETKIFLEVKVNLL